MSWPMSWRTALEIVGFMIAAGVIGLIIGYLLGVASKAARSSWSATRKAKAEKGQRDDTVNAMLADHARQVERLEEQLATSRAETERWCASYSRIAIELERIAQLTPELLLEDKEMLDRLKLQIEQTDRALTRGASD